MRTIKWERSGWDDGRNVSEAMWLSSPQGKKKGNDKVKDVALRSDFLRLCFRVYMTITRTHSLHFRFQSTDKKSQAPQVLKADVGSSFINYILPSAICTFLERQKQQRPFTRGATILWLPEKKKKWRKHLWLWERISHVICRVPNPKDQFWVFIGGTDAEAETPVFWQPHEKSWLIGKDPDAGRDWGQEEKGTTEDEMAGWHHRLDGHEFE